ncbi:MAG: ChbG/HpnK family deacetylase [Chloroflexota bacterium]
MTKYLIVNSDDYGISEGVSRGILEAHHNGIVTSTSVMVNMPYAAEAITTAQQIAPQLGLGLHFVLSFGEPISPPEKVPSLVTEAGTFVSTLDDLREKSPSFTSDDLATELNAQFRRFVELAGTNPDHIDSHHAINYNHPVAYEIMLMIAQKHNLPYRRPQWLDDKQDLDENFISTINALHEKYGQPMCPDFTVNSTAFWDRRSRIEPLRQAITNTQDGYTEILCHVGYGANLNELYNIQREDELATFIHPEIVAMVKDDPKFQLIRFSDLPSKRLA